MNMEDMEYMDAYFTDCKHTVLYFGILDQAKSDYRGNHIWKL